MKKIFALLVLASVAQVSAAADAQGDANAAKNKVAMCIGCHGIPGYKATYPEVYRVPMLGGQSEKYIVAALNAYKKALENTLPANISSVIDSQRQGIRQAHDKIKSMRDAAKK